MDKYLGKDIENKAERIAFLADNCDAVEERDYMRPYSPEQLQGHKETLANLSIEISEVENELKLAKAEFQSRLKPLKEQRSQMVENIKAKSEYVTEKCYKITDHDERMTGYYNADGDLIECRPATADELQPNMFHMIRHANEYNHVPAVNE